MKNTLCIELGDTPQECLTDLHKIKDAMVQAMFLKINSTGLPGDQDEHFRIWQAIYLEADLHTSQASLLLPALAG